MCSRFCRALHCLILPTSYCFIGSHCECIHILVHEALSILKRQAKLPSAIDYQIKGCYLRRPAHVTTYLPNGLLEVTNQHDLCQRDRLAHEEGTSRKVSVEDL